MTPASTKAALAVAILALAWLPGAAQAQSVTRHQGEVVSVDPSAHTLRVETLDGPRSFEVTTWTRFAGEDGRLELGDLAPGNTVVLQSFHDEAGEELVDFVRVVEPAELDAALVVSDAAELPAFAIADTVTFVSYDAGASEIVVRTGHGTRTLGVDAATRIRSGEDAISAAGLEPGERVVVSAVRRDGRLVVSDLTVVAEPEAAPR